MSELQFNTVEEGIVAFKKGEMIILMDDKSRENEGDFCLAAEFTTPEDINFMSKYGRGLICLALTTEQTNKLNLELMVDNNKSRYSTNFTTSIEAAKGVTTGISAFDRAITIKTAVSNNATPQDIVTPGHVFPLRAKIGGVLQRAGQTEGSVDLAKLAGLTPAAVICEILAEDGTMARYPDLIEVAKKFNLKLLSIKDIIEYRLKKDILVTMEAEADLPTKFGNFRIVGFNNKLNGESYVAIKMGTWKKDEPVLVRVHSQCLTGDVFSSMRCDCQDQLHRAMEIIAKEGKGVILYLPQEGRGIGIINKIKAYSLQEHGRDTVQANEELGFRADLREYGFGAQCLYLLGLKKLRLLTNNPKKIVALSGFNLEVVERVPIEIHAVKENESYLQTKRSKMGHLLDL